VQTKKKSQWSKFLVGFISFLFLGAFLINGTFRSQDELSTIEEVPVGFDDPQKWRDVGTPTGLGGKMGYTKSVKFTKEDIASLGKNNPAIFFPSNFEATNLFGPDDSALAATYRVPYLGGRSKHLDFPKDCKDGQIVATDLALSSCSLVVGTSPKNKTKWRGYHDFGYVVKLNAANNQYEANGEGKGYINWVNRPVSDSQAFAGGPWHYRPALTDPNDDLNDDEYIEVNRQLSWIHYDHYTYGQKSRDISQTYFWGLKCNGGQWERMIYHFTHSQARKR